MNKTEYLDNLKRALGGLPPDAAAKTLAYYEQRFIDGMVAGRADTEIAAELGDPKKIAMTLRANIHMQSFEARKTPFSLLRMLGSLFGLLVFNLFMLVPAVVYAGLVSALYFASLCFYVAGIAITASGLSGANELVLDGPLRQELIQMFDIDDRNEHGPMQTRILISNDGINLSQEPASRVLADGEPDDEIGDAGEDNRPQRSRAGRVLERAEALAGSGLHVSSDLDAESRTTQGLFGLGVVMGGIVLFLIGLVISKYSWVALKRYMAMNLALLRGR